MTTAETLPEYRCIHCYRAFTALSGSPVFRLCERCSTWEEAEAQHAAMVAKFAAQPRPAAE